MTMPDYVSFYQRQTNTIVKALTFTITKIEEFYDGVVKAIGKSHSEVVLQKKQKTVDEINLALQFLAEYPDTNFFRMSEDSLTKITNIIRSALEIYATEISKVATAYDIEQYNETKREIEELYKTDILKDARTDLFEKFYEPQVGSYSKPKFFISYSSEDKRLAGKIRDIIANTDSEVFLAHRDIPMSKEWRDEIFSHLESCTILLAVCTENFLCCAWGNQEVGIAMEKRKKIIPIFAQGTKKDRFGFLEAIQGYPKEFSEDNLESVIKEILEVAIP